ncbi:hypothetical protein [Jiangella asiatica]|uniref:Uncharacterized protein n=1 Tax=Jiangella asiatica TaxID=2530372 RepID=A0A4V2Z4C3_9ACTN|nr:hypothetical protein [Jiangella asiatica]TDE16038.1 hypothetical protein E1269_01775 [Jiangella asiatica]
MRQSLTAVLERNTTVRGEFETEPYEVAWATEARWFVQVLSATGDPVELELVTQLSPDGITWCDHDEASHLATGLGLTSWAVREFGHWLRLRGRVRGDDAEAKLRVYLAVKS